MPSEHPVRFIGLPDFDRTYPDFSIVVKDTHTAQAGHLFNMLGVSAKTPSEKAWFSDSCLSMIATAFKRLSENETVEPMKDVASVLLNIVMMLTNCQEFQNLWIFFWHLL